jgi:hypothetical protein
VKLPADVLSDGRHGTLLVDSMCQPGGISIGFGSEKDPEDVAGLFRALFTGIPGTIDKHIRATFVGRFRVVKTDSGERYELASQHVSDLIVTPPQR